MGQGHGPGPGPMDQAIISEAANAADFKGVCGGAEPPHMKKVQTFLRLHEFHQDIEPYEASLPDGGTQLIKIISMFMHSSVN